MSEQGKKGKMYVYGDEVHYMPDGGEPMVIGRFGGPLFEPKSRLFRLAGEAWARASLATRAAWAALRGRNVEIDARPW